MLYIWDRGANSMSAQSSKLSSYGPVVIIFMLSKSDPLMRRKVKFNNTDIIIDFLKIIPAFVS